jgi:hypothetical protein
MNTDNSMPAITFGKGGSLLSDRHIPKLTQPLDDETAKFYGAKYFIGESIMEASAEVLTEAIHDWLRKGTQPEDQRAAFEKWISSSPYEREVLRYGEDESQYAWPGQYRNIAVQLAWEAWCEAAGKAERQ